MSLTHILFGGKEDGFLSEKNSPVIGTDRVEWVDCSVDHVGSAEGIALGETLAILQPWLCRNISSCVALLSHLDHY